MRNPELTMTEIKMQKRIIAIIPARGGSKRLPGKNILQFLGKPLIAYSILLAKNCELVENVYVSTDDAKIAEVATAYGAIVINRPEELSTDNSRTVDAIRHTLEVVMKSEVQPDGVLTLQPTSPLRPDELVRESIALFTSRYERIDSLVTVSENRTKFGLIEEEYFKPVGYHFGQRSQDMKKFYYENGLLYLTKTSILLKDNTLFGSNVMAKPIDSIYGEIDIDTQLDFEWAEYIGTKIINKNTHNESFF